MTKYLDFPDDELDLLELIGKDVPSEELGMFSLPPGREESIRRAKQWLSGQHAVLRERICGNKKIHELEADVKQKKHSLERDLLFDLVCEVLAETYVHMPVGAVSAYLVRRSIRSYCEQPE